MKHIIIYLSILWLMVLVSCRNDVVGPSSDCTLSIADSSSMHPKAARYQQLIDDYTHRGLPGIVLLIRDSSGLWIGASGKADIENNINMQPCAVSKVASITKMVMATVTLQLVDEGVLNLDAPISTWLEDRITSRIENADQATLRQILNHTSGIYDVISDQGFYLDLLNNPDRNLSAEDILEHVYGKPAAFAVGTSTGYSNTNFLLLSLILENATGKPHGDLIRERIILPLGLSDTYYFYHDDLPTYTAQGYFDLYNNGHILNLTNYNTGSGNGYTGLYSSVRDLQVFTEALFVDKTLLSQAMLDEMQTFTAIDYDGYRRFGLGIYKDFIDRADSTEFAYGHRGRDLAYSADAFWFPKNNTTMAFLVNYGTNGSSALADVFFEFRDKVADEIFNEQ